MPIHSSPAVQPDSGGAARLALAIALALAWTNLLTTGRWADEPGALHGWRLWPYGVTLAVATLVTLVWGRKQGAPASTTESRGVAAAGGAMLAAAFLTTFPLGLWNQIPFYDDWPGLLQLTLNGIDTLKHGAVVGWQWAFLGGYHTSADLSQSLAVPAWLPIALAGPNVGFHVFLALVTIAIPVAVWFDITASDGAIAGAYAGGLSAVVTGGYFATVMHSGMGNSVAGAASVAVALMASHAARQGKRWGGPLLALALTLSLYSHAAFFGYATVCLAVEALFYRDWRGFARSVTALGVAFVAALPLHWELVRHPDWFVTNNLHFEAPPSFDWPGLLRQIWWATEILALPWRWFNDYGGLTYVFLVVLAWMTWRDRTRAGFYAWATLAIVLTLRFNSPQIGLVAGRQLHLLPVLVAPAIAGFISRHVPGGLSARLAVVAVIAMFVAVPYTPVPHVPDVRRFNPTLVDRIQQAGGHLVLVENNPHWDMISDRAVRTERSRFDVHFESLLPAATGKLFFGQPQDGYHRSRFRGYSLAGGGFRGLAIDAVPPQQLVAELRRWGVQHLFVWSDRSQRYLASRREFGLRWQERDWQEFQLIDADPRSVATASGQGILRHLTPVGGEVVLHGVAVGTPVVVRTHFYPAWSARAAGKDVTLRADGDQLAFDAPAGGDIVVQLSYDRRTWLTILSIATLIVGMAVLTRVGSA
jgi:hypothetical protein